MMFHSLLVVAALAVTAPLAAQGGGPAGLPARASAHVEARPKLLLAHAASTGSHWKEGMIDGAVIGALVSVLGALALHGACDTAECGVRGFVFVLPVVAFAFLGGLIGSLSPQR